MNSQVFFVSDKVKQDFEELNNGKFEEKELSKWLINSFEGLENNAFSGIQIPKKLFPKDYGHLDNLWKLNLPNAWRLLYTVNRDENNLIVIIIEWLNHKKYEKRFKY